MQKMLFFDRNAFQNANKKNQENMKKFYVLSVNLSMVG